MSKVLRVFRGRPWKKNPFYKYIAYALGEVFLIVVGILAAVSIGNWNDERKNEQAINKITAAIGDDLQEDLLQYEFLLKRHYRLDSILQRGYDGNAD